jgi:hypothetical protein
MTTQPEQVTEWPYDARQDDPLTALRIPVTPPMPAWVYLVVFDKESDERPTDQEATLLASYIDYQREHWFNPTWQAKLMGRPFDIDGGHNTLVLHKYGEDDWAYRRVSWTMGPRFYPPYNRKPEQKMSLAALLDHNHTHGDHLYHHWADWKAAHPDLFPEATS